jgi:hypothetical protein
MSLAALIRRMSDAGATPEAIALAVEAIEAEQAKEQNRKAKRAAQKAAQRARQSPDCRATVAGQGADGAATTPAPNDALPNLETVEVNLNPTPLKAPRPKSDFPRDGFEQWYAIYPRHEAPKRARKAFTAVERSGEVTFADLMAATRRFAASVAGKERQFIPHPATWLNGGCWADEQPSATVATRATGQTPAGFWAHRESDQFEAWVELGHHPPSQTDRNGGWLFPSEFPPQVHMQAAE